MKKADKQFGTASPIYEIIWRQVVFPKTNCKKHYLNLLDLYIRFTVKLFILLHFMFFNQRSNTIIIKVLIKNKGKQELRPTLVSKLSPYLALFRS